MAVVCSTPIVGLVARPNGLGRGSGKLSANRGQARSNRPGTAHGDPRLSGRRREPAGPLPSVGSQRREPLSGLDRGTDVDSVPGLLNYSTASFREARGATGITFDSHVCALALLS